MPFGICALRAVDALRMRTAMALDCRCHRSAEGEDALLRCVLLRTRCVKGAGAGPGLGIGLVWGLVWFGFWFWFWFWLAARESFCLHPRFAFVARRVWFAGVCAGIRVLPSCFKRRPCAGRHLLFFAAAKKSRQKKAANTASSCVCLRAPTGSYTSHGNHVTHVRCQRSCAAPHPLHPPALHHAVPDSPRPPRWQTVCRP